jgi:hypothetical protein
MSSTAKRRSEKVLVRFTQACAPYAKDEVAALPVEMAQSVLNAQGVRPPVAVLHLDGVPKPRSRDNDATSAVEALRRRADKAEGALAALERTEAAKR